MSKIVIALGGNSLGNTAKEQLAQVSVAVKPLADLIEAGHQVVITHGNGPQVGQLQEALSDLATKQENPEVALPLAESTAMTQGYIGFHLQNALKTELALRNIKKEVVAIVSQVQVDANDPALKNPTKPIGVFFSETEAKEMQAAGIAMVEDSGRGYRKVVASPMPISFVEEPVLNLLVDNGVVPIVGGGGGIPVVKHGEQYVGVDGVIDKDLSSAIIARELNADIFIILTGVEKVALNYGTPDELWLGNVSVGEMEQYKAEGHFAPGSMLPKVEAALAFVGNDSSRSALITLLEKAQAGVDGETGTKISSKI